MKNCCIVSLAVSIFLSCLLSCNKPESAPGSIYGTVVDKATSDPISGVGVKLLPKGISTVTGSDGTFEFLQIEPGDYNLYVTKTGYQDLTSSGITVSSGETAKGDVQIEKLPMALRVVDSEGKDISTLDFGAEQDVTSRTFSVFNDSPQRLTWWVEENCSWIIEVKSMLTNNQSGDLESGRQEPIKVTIDRSLLESGLKTYILNVNSSSGSKELLITAGEEVCLPTLTTQQISNVSNNSVTFHGTIVNPGLPSYTERGFVYSTKSQPTLEENTGKITAAVNEQASFSASVSGLSSSVNYYVRAYAINEIGVGYGNDVPFSTNDVVTSLTTSAVTNINATSATLNGTIIDEGSPNYSEKGFCYSKTGEPSISDNKITVLGIGTGTYSVDVSGLEYQTSYRVKAYAIQNGKPVYGNTVSFSTSWTSVEVNTSAATNIGATNAKLNGSIANVGSPEYLEKGFCYCKSPGEPTISNNKVVVSGSGAGDYSYSLNNLEYQTTYNVKAYAIQNDLPVYGNMVEFTTVWAEVQVNTSAVSGIESTEAVFNGSIANAGVPAYTERGFCYSSNTSLPSISDTKVVVNGSGVTGNYNKKITGLVNGSTYYVRAYAMQGGEAVYGQAVNFTTKRVPVVHTLEITDLTPVSSGGVSYSWSVTFNGFVEDAGNPEYVERGFCYGNYSNPTGNKTVVSGSGIGGFSKNVSNLLYYKTYYVRAYVKTPSGQYIYGQNISFSTYDK